MASMLPYIGMMGVQFGLDWLQGSRAEKEQEAQREAQLQYFREQQEEEKRAQQAQIADLNRQINVQRSIRYTALNAPKTMMNYGGGYGGDYYYGQ